MIRAGLALGLLGASLGATPAGDVQISPDQARSAGWMADRVRSATWTPARLAARYGVAPPGLQTQLFATPQAFIDMEYITPQAAGDAKKLWSGLQADLAPNESLARKGTLIVRVVSEDAKERERALAWIAPELRGRPEKPLDWVLEELPREIGGLRFSHAAVLPNLPLYEERVGGLPLRMVYQKSFTTDHVGFRSTLAQADFWAPRKIGDLAELVRRLAEKSPDEQTVLSGKGIAVVVTARNPSGRKILMDRLLLAGYRPEPKAASPQPAPNPEAGKIS
jgi:hypothetical protein